MMLTDLFTSLSEDEKFDWINVWMKVALHDKDASGIDACMTMISAMLKEAKEEGDGDLVARCLKAVMGYYPKGNLLDIQPGEIPAESLREPKAILVDTRHRMLRIIADFWEAESTERSVEVFEFLCAAARPLVVEEGGNGADLHPAEARNVSDVIRLRIGADPRFTHKALTYWLADETLPTNVKDVLGVAWQRTGGIDEIVGMCKVDVLRS